MKKLLIAAGLALAAVTAIAAPASGITRGGVPDGDDHPYVGLMVAQNEDRVPMWRCSGTLVSPTLFVTAGHCVDGDAAHVELWFASSLEPDRASTGYPFVGEASGTPYMFPGYDPGAFYIADLGVVVLDEPYDVERYGELPEVGRVDELGTGRDGAAVTAVGYGLQKTAAGANPAVAELTRMRADLMIVNTKAAFGAGSVFGLYSMTLSGDAAHGGTCFGDSGGPTLERGTDVLLAVTSFGMNSQCAGPGGVYRIDHPDALAWLESF
jgi:hypothetical protein